ncbi:hypothetical protein Rhow_001096 [Rhodococcus wratislaviensis]|uniref:Uncharacterized protein n=1 Tax=Rhodococcus wratislaviensis TaxID=44752 RepID=A0A402C3H7_RHOWR|nr:hypothetical protein Rhow_001096 [Rhodococcus wratislaviensis]
MRRVRLTTLSQPLGARASGYRTHPSRSDSQANRTCVALTPPTATPTAYRGGGAFVPARHGVE